MIEFALIPLAKSKKAHDWHWKNAETTSHIFPRNLIEFKKYASEGELWGAWDQQGQDFAGQVYCTYDGGTWEVGGLLVDSAYRKAGIGSVLAHLAIGHLLYTENPFASSHAVVAHLHESNRQANFLIKQLQLVKTGTKEVPAWQLPTMESDASGVVRGRRFSLVKPNSLKALIKWCENWNGKLKDGSPASIVLSSEATLALWVAVFHEMAK